MKIGNLYDDYLICEKCNEKYSSKVLEHFCMLPEGIAFTAPTLAEQLDGVKDAKIDEITVCTYCDKETKWENKPEGYQWICSHCGKLNNRQDNSDKAICPICSKTLVPRSGGMICESHEHPQYKESCSDGGCMPVDVIIDPIYRVDRTSQINTKDLYATPGRYIGVETTGSNMNMGHTQEVYYPPTLAEREKIAQEKGLLDPWKLPMIQAIAAQVEGYVTGGKIHRGSEKLTIYLSGPMSGIENFNIPEFEKYAQKYRTEGLNVISPPELIDPSKNLSYESFVLEDVLAMLNPKVDRIYLMPGWGNSKGAQFEKYIAEWFKIPVYDAETGELFKETITKEAERIVYGSRRKTYGHALENFDHTAGVISAAFKNKLKEPLIAEDIAILMMIFKISRIILSPDHRDSLVDITGYGLCYADIREARSMQKREMHKTEGNTP